jgi:hypothetical protein
MNDILVGMEAPDIALGDAQPSRPHRPGPGAPGVGIGRPAVSRR